jgi:hypothetical protein
VRQFLPHTILGIIMFAACAFAGAVAVLAPLPDGDADYNVGAFLVRHSWVKFAYVAGTPFGDDLTSDEESALVARFFALNTEIRALEQAQIAGINAAASEEHDRTAREERARIENRVERILEGRLTALIKDAGLTRHIGRDLVWPPVNIEFEEPPAVLVRSPRAEIRRLEDRLLDGGLPVKDRERIEADAEADGEMSALVVQIGAIATYPAIVPPVTDYRSALRTVAHEWVHHYLYFAHLGRSFYDSDRLITLNETVANIVGDELGDVLFERYPLQATPDYVLTGSDGVSASSTLVTALGVSAVGQARFFAPLRMTASGESEFDFGREMRGLRLEVDALLGEGRVDDAERVMDERRKVFVENGYSIRRINQAYFAFHGSYADTPASSDPIGPKMRSLRERAESLEAFLETAREFSSVDDLDAALR